MKFRDHKIPSVLLPFSSSKQKSTERSSSQIMESICSYCCLLQNKTVHKEASGEVLIPVKQSREKMKYLSNLKPGEVTWQSDACPRHPAAHFGSGTLHTLCLPQSSPVKFSAILICKSTIHTGRQVEGHWAHIHPFTNVVKGLNIHSKSQDTRS